MKRMDDMDIATMLLEIIGYTELPHLDWKEVQAICETEHISNENPLLYPFDTDSKQYERNDPGYPLLPAEQSDITTEGGCKRKNCTPTEPIATPAKRKCIFKPYELTGTVYSSTVTLRDTNHNTSIPQSMSDKSSFDKPNPVYKPSRSSWSKKTGFIYSNWWSSIRKDRKSAAESTTTLTDAVPKVLVQEARLKGRFSGLLACPMRDNKNHAPEPVDTTKPIKKRQAPAWMDPMESEKENQAPADTTIPDYKRKTPSPMDTMEPWNKRKKSFAPIYETITPPPTPPPTCQVPHPVNSPEISNWNVNVDWSVADATSELPTMTLNPVISSTQYIQHTGVIQAEPSIMPHGFRDTVLRLYPYTYPH